MHVIITRRASSENLDAKELRFLSLGRSSSSCNETPRIVAGGRPKCGGRRLENKKKKKRKNRNRQRQKKDSSLEGRKGSRQNNEAPLREDVFFPRQVQSRE